MLHRTLSAHSAGTGRSHWGDRPPNDTRPPSLQGRAPASTDRSLRAGSARCALSQPVRARDDVSAAVNPRTTRLCAKAGVMGGRGRLPSSGTCCRSFVARRNHGLGMPALVLVATGAAAKGERYLKRKIGGYRKMERDEGVRGRERVGRLCSAGHLASSVFRRSLLGISVVDWNGSRMLTWI